MMEKALLAVLKNIENGLYRGKSLDSLQDLPQRIAADVQVNKDEAKAILGYLFKYEYAEIDEEGGLVFKKNSMTDKLIRQLR